MTRTICEVLVLAAVHTIYKDGFCSISNHGAASSPYLPGVSPCEEA